MTAKNKIKSWKWRIVRTEHSAKSFAALVKVPATQLSEYFSGKKTPSLKRFDFIEGKLKELEAKLNIV